ncbi:MAG: hypothetical protein ACYCOU_24615 [Sulfobacillus sp.]
MDQWPMAQKSHMCYTPIIDWTVAFYKTTKGQCPVTDFLASLTDKQAAKVLRSMHLV